MTPPNSEKLYSTSFFCFSTASMLISITSLTLAFLPGKGVTATSAIMLLILGFCEYLLIVRMYYVVKEYDSIVSNLWKTSMSRCNFSEEDMQISKLTGWFTTRDHLTHQEDVALTELLKSNPKLRGDLHECILRSYL